MSFSLIGMRSLALGSVIKYDLILIYLQRPYFQIKSGLRFQEDKTSGGHYSAHNTEKSREELGPGGLAVRRGLSADPAARCVGRQKFGGFLPHALFH